MEDSLQHIIATPVVSADSTESSSFLPEVDGFVFSSKEISGRDAFVVVSDAGEGEEGGILPSKYSTNVSDLLAVVVMLLCLMVLRSRALYTKYFNHLLQALVSRTASVKLYRERNVLFVNMSRLLLPSSLAIISVFVTYVGARFFEVDVIAEHMMISIFAVFLVLAFFHGYRSLIHRMVGVLFFVEQETKEHLFNQRVFVMGLGVFLLPFSLIMPFVPSWLFDPLVFSGAALTVLLLLSGFVRSLQIIFERKLSFFYLILYICSFEILPIVILLKAIQSVV